MLINTFFSQLSRDTLNFNYQKSGRRTAMTQPGKTAKARLSQFEGRDHIHLPINKGCRRRIKTQPRRIHTSGWRIQMMGWEYDIYCRSLTKTCCLLFLQLFNSFWIPPFLFIHLALGLMLPAAPPSVNHSKQSICLLVWDVGRTELNLGSDPKRLQHT